MGIQEAIVDYIQVVRDRDTLTWDAVIEEWPNIGDAAWFELLMNWVGSVATIVLTNSIKEEILNRLLMDEQDNSDDEQSSQVFYQLQYDIPIVFIVFHFFPMSCLYIFCFDTEDCIVCMYRVVKNNGC